jgi:hypothetical protein
MAPALNFRQVPTFRVTLEVFRGQFSSCRSFFGELLTDEGVFGHSYRFKLRARLGGREIAQGAAARRRPVCPGADEPPAARTKLRLVPVQAGSDAVDVRNLGAAQAKGVACTRLLPFGRVGLCCRRQHQDRKRRCQHQTELEIPGPGGNHESPQSIYSRIVGEGRGLGKDARHRC